MKKIEIDAKIFEQKYIDENLSLEQMAGFFHCSTGTIKTWIKKLGLIKTAEAIKAKMAATNIEKYGAPYPAQNKEIRARQKETCRERYGADSPLSNKDIQDKILEGKNAAKHYKMQEIEMPSRELLDDLYNHQDFSRQELGDYFGVAPTTIGRWLKELHISKEKQSVSRRKRKEAYDDRFSREEVENLYITQNLSMREMAKIMGLSITAVFRLLRYYNIKKDEEVIKKNTEQTNLKRYGVINPFLSPFFQEKANNTRIERTGYAHPKYVGKSEWVVNLMTNPSKFREYVVQQGYTDTLQIAQALNIDRTTAANLVNRSDSWDLIDMTRSSSEKEVGAFLESLGVKNFHTRQIIAPYEIDLYCPEYNIGIEFNGDYWHSSDFHDSKYHYKKSELARQKGVFLYHIFEYEWEDGIKQQRIKNQLRNLFCKNENRVYARDCEIRKVPLKEKNIFLDKNHVQGADRCNLALGLYKDSKLMCIMTFCKPRFNKNYDWELSRFCSAANTTVVGGASKLWKYFLNSTCGSIISYSDIAKTRGGVYEKLGFKCVRISAPNYVWRDKQGKIKTRYQTQMKNEVAIMEKEGYVRIFDCGNKVWVYERK